MPKDVVRKVGRRARKLRRSKGRTKKNLARDACLDGPHARQGELANLSGLVGEYRALLEGPKRTLLQVKAVLAGEADWTPAAAQHLVQLVREYGSFMLRNATAIAIVLGIEDGELGL